MLSCVEDGCLSHKNGFIRKLGQLILDPSMEGTVYWLTEKCFVIQDETKLLAIMAQYYRHANLSSFYRQLNIYGFKKARRAGLSVIYHPNIQPGKPLHATIRRKSFRFKKSRRGSGISAKELLSRANSYQAAVIKDA